MSDSDTDEVEEYEAFAQPTLIDQLKKILDEYPDDGQIIKELIQNADDAGATCMKILYVGHAFNPYQNGEKKYRKFLRGPALVFYNDAQFSQDDWTGIRTIYNSVKADDPLTVGRFGLGFKSVFHITDFPCIISGDRILFLNPLERRSDRVCVTIKLNKLQQSKTVDVSDVLTAFSGVFGFSDRTLQDGAFPGTVFWFPLRSEETKLSGNMYPEGRVMDLFRAFMSDAERSLLFLNGLQSIRLYCSMDTMSVTSDEARLRIPNINFGKDTEFFSVELREIPRNDSSTKARFRQQIVDLNGSIPDQTMYKLLRCELHLTRRQSMADERPQTTIQNWFNLNLHPGEPITDDLRTLIDDKALCYSPLVSVAACIEQDSRSADHKHGKIFCFQPLPDEMENRTGLPVHVNAFFALTQNRRHIKLPSADQEHFNMQVAKPIEWNLALMREILPEAYVELILGIIESSRNTHSEDAVADIVYTILPDFNKVNPKWVSHADKVFTLLLDKRFLYTKAGGGEWVCPEEATYALPDCIEAIQYFLLKNNVKLVVVPKHILTAIEERISSGMLTKVCPEFIVRFMTEEESYKKLLSFQQKIDLLHFLIASEFKSQLDGLELIPLENGQFASLGSGDSIFIEKPEIVRLFPGLEEHFISTDIDDQTTRVFEDIAISGDYQVRKLDAAATAMLIELLMENEFESLLPPLRVDKGKSKQWKELLKGIWTTIMTRFPEHIESFANLPLFPVFSKRAWSKVLSFSLCPLSSLLLYRMDKDGKQIPTELCSVFELLSVNVIHSLPDWLDIKVIDKFVYRCTGASLATLFGKLNSKSVQYFNKNASDEQKSMLLSFVSEKFNADILGEDAKAILAQLKMFKEMTSHWSVYKLVTAESSRGVVDCKKFPVRFPEPLLHLESNEEVFVAILKMKKVTSEQMVLKTLQIIDAYSKDDVLTFMHWVLVNRFHEQNDKIAELVEDVPFLDAEENVYKPAELFDPSDSLLTSLFAGFHVFPIDKRFTTPDMLHILKKVGLKSRSDVACEDIYNICIRIHSSGTYKKDNKKAMHILKFLNMMEHSELLRSSQISNLNWIPVRDESRPDILQYNKGRGTLVSPLNVRSSEYRDIVGSVLPLVDCEKYAQVAQNWKWCAQPQIEDVVSQLLTIVQNYSNNRNSEILPAVTAIYEWFDYSLRSPSEVQKALDESFSLRDKKYIWTGSGFESNRSIIVNRQTGDINLKPFLWFLPSELSRMKDFFLAIGCKDTIETEDYIGVLARISETCETKEHDNSRNLLQLTIRILNKIKDDVEQGTFRRNSTIFVPVQSSELLLKPAEECTYGSRHKSVEEGLLCVHEDLPVATAEAVGVRSFKQQMMSELVGIEEWGQSEPLTRRLNNLLKEGYVDGFSVPKELFQNADDAKASKLWILYDERENEDARIDLLDDAMSEVQGPALWVYNDAKFTEEDFRNITKLSGATKQPDSSKIGKFGLGFCSVYNLTDVPSFLSGNSIVMFDPHSKFLGKALPGKSPGLRINLKTEKNRRMVKRLSHQFMPFENIFGCTTLHEMPEYNGTLFRLPLRNRKSDISDVIYRGNEIQDLMSKIKQYSSNLLIFSQNVKEVKLFHLKNGNQPENMKMLFSCEKSVQQIRSVLEEASRKKKEHILEEDPLKVIENVSIKTYDCDKKFSGAAHWLVAWATGTDKESIDMTYTDKGALPLAATAVPFELDDGDYSIKDMKDLHSGFYQRSHFFCFLPLPLEHDFRFHINGQFSVSSDRRRLRTVEEEDKRKLYQDWNESLMQDAVVVALVHMIENAKTLGNCTSHSFYKIWPQEDKAQFTIYLFKSFYKYIIVNDNDVFEKNGRWYPISDCEFIDPDLRDHSVGDFAFEILNTYSTDAVAIDVPTRYYRYLREANKVIIEQKTVDKIAFILKYFLPNLSAVPSRERNALLKYAIELNHPDIDAWIKSNKSFPTHPNEELKLPQDVIDRHSSVGQLFADNDGRFLLKEFETEIGVQRLRELGMIHNHLSDGLLVDRANRIGQLDKKCVACGLNLCKLLIQYIIKMESKHKEAWMPLRSVQFLPIARRPDGWPSEWEADGLIGTKLKKTKLCNDHKGQKHENRPVYERGPALYCSNLGDYIGCAFLLFDARLCVQTEHISKVDAILQKRLGMQGIVDVRPEMVLQQLTSFSDSCEINADSGDAQCVNGVMRTLYKFLNNHKELATLSFPDRDIVWTSRMFTRPCKVALSNFELDCSPFFFDLQKSPLRPYSTLREVLKIKDNFTPEDIISELCEIAGQSENRPVAPKHRKGVLNLLESLCLVFSSSKMGNSVLFDDACTIYAPDQDWILRESKTMCFNDNSGVDASDTMVLVNEDLTIRTATAIGIKSMLAQMLHDSSDSVEFFQDEPLVTRLNNILAGYPCDSGIFKELIQNADDAGAQEIHFLIDFDTYGSDVFDTSFERLQGPALCVYNDKPFTQNDLKGIRNLGKGSKGEDPSKTGQYGVGFNSVYNLTDAPSFLTKGSEIENGETLCIFDPMAIYLPRSFISKEKPGRRFKDVNTIRTKHGDVIPPYNESYFSMENCGTIFRFPLRTKTTGYKSEIKDNHVSPEDVNTMLSNFKREASDTLIFLKNLREIKLSVKRIQNATLEMHVEVDIAVKDLEKRNTYFEKHATMCQQFKKNRATIFSLPTLTVDYQIKISEKEKYPEFIKVTEYLIVQTVGYKDFTAPAIIEDKCKSGELGLLPQGGVATILSTKTGNRTFKGSGKNSKLFCFLPLPGDTGLPVHVNGHFALDHEGRRGLWKSDHFEQTTCYKTLWNKSLIEGVLTPAYTNLLDILKRRVSSKVEGKTTLFPIVKDVVSEYNAFLPMKTDVLEDYWLFLLRLVYKRMVEQEREFLPLLFWVMDDKVAGSIPWKAHLTWTSLNRDGGQFPAFFNETALGFDDDKDVNDEKRKNGCTLTNIFFEIGMRIVVVPKDIRDSLKCAGIVIEALSPKIAIEFLCSHKQDKTDVCSIQVNTCVENTDVRSVEHMCHIVRYCIKDKAYFLERIRDLPVFITTDKHIRLVSVDHPVFVTHFHDFFENVQNKFLCPEMTRVFLEKGKNFLQSPELKPFNIQDFKHLLKNSPLSILERTDVYAWVDHSGPSKQWVTNVWKFFKEEIGKEKQKGDKKNERCAAVKKLLKLFNDTAVIPAFKRSVTSAVEELYLVPPCKLDITMNVSNFQSGTLKTAFQKLNLLTVHKDIINDNNTGGLFEDIDHEVPNSTNSEKIAICLYQNKDKVIEAKLSSSDAEAILDYLADNCGKLDNVVPKVRELPLFITHHGELIALSDYNKVVSLQSDHLPMDGLDLLAKEKNTAFLKNWKNMKKLYKALGIVSKSAGDLYLEYIIPNQSMLSRKQFYAHILFISTKLLSLDQYENKEASGKRKKMIDMLSSCKFIETRLGKCVCASELFNPNVKTFRIFCKNEELLPQTLEKDFKINPRFFESLGLRTQMTVQLFERFAKAISENGKQLPISKSLRKKSGRLLKVFTDIQQEIKEQSGFQSLARVPFIIPLKIPEQLATMGKPFLEEERMVCFSESVFYDKLDITWTACPVLPNALKVDDSIRCNLEAKPAMFAKLFVSHCKNVGETIVDILKKSIDKGTGDKIDSVMKSIYEHLLILTEKGELGEEMLKSLRDVPLVYFKDEPLMLKANQTVIACTSKEEIRPYLNKMPIYLGKYSDTFQALGAAKEASVKSYMYVLECLKDKCSNDEMLEPDLLIAKAAVVNLLVCGVKGSKEEFPESAVLYLPTLRRGIEDARSVVYCDNNYFRKRIGTNTTVNYFLGLDKLEITEVNGQQCLLFFKSLPATLRPVLLTDIVEETVDSAALKEKSDVRIRVTEAFIRSSAFSQGLIRLVKHAYKDDSRPWESTLETTLPKKLRQIRLIAASGMKTVLKVKTYADGEFKNPKRVPKSDEIKPIHFEETQDSTKLYVVTGTQEWQDDLNQAIAQHLNSFLNNCFKDELLLLFLNFFKHSDRPGVIADMLDKKKIVSHTFTSFEEPSLFSKPGVIVPLKYHQYLDNSYEVIYEYEFNCVAYELDDPLMEEGANMDATATYVYARILRKLEQADSSPLFDLYEIDVGENDPIQVPAYRLFKFVRKTNTSNEVTIYERQGTNDDERQEAAREGANNNSSNGAEPEGRQELSIHAVCREIKECLTEAYTKDEATRKRIVKRLWLKWHPDKNPDKVEFSTKVFQYIQQCLGKLDKGHRLDDYSDSTHQKEDSSGQPNSSGGSRYWRRRADDSEYWRHFYEQFERERRRGGDSDSGPRRRNRSGSPMFEETEREPYRWPQAAKRWQRQAKKDFGFAMDCLGNAVLPSYNWICYIFHQAAEKSLRAAWYAKDANRLPGESTTDLATIASGLIDTLKANSEGITRITRDRRGLTHPKRYGDAIPADEYTKEDANNVSQYTKEIIKHVDDFYL